ncbi:uncharacterized protein LOC111713174 [Eurytemora carolleeae]|uniref:uncharacterized protein LOC111713174 n=1 Tax=Eurytemora carolleeae TaxID=1294199 RepID=UPI000C77BD85|nr:uncharacterized protein LOC111713174 [Eurytemora carolleeae]|eukprot:XP_023343760.1 uncharacterized protein LOC111713174 [Eurytemora affinis]
MNLTVSDTELDTVYRASSKLILRVFIRNFLVEDLTQYTHFPKIMWLEEGNMLEMRLVLNLSKNAENGGFLNINIGNIHLLILHRVYRLLQMYCAPVPLNLIYLKLRKIKNKLPSPSFSPIPSLGLKVSMEGPTFIIPVSRDTQDTISVYSGRTTIENFKCEDRYQSILVDTVGAQDKMCIFDMNVYSIK